MTRILVLITAIVSFVSHGAKAEPVRIMVAANFKDCLTELADQYTARTGQEILVSNGATGTLFAQISAGAPCHVFFAADAERPARLVDEGLAEVGSRVTYAIGRLVLWRPGVTASVDDIKTMIMAADLDGGQHLAMANPLHAPYGLAARQALQATGQWDAVQPHLVKGQSAGQTWQFVHTGAARLGFVSLAQIRAAKRAEPKKNLGQVLVVPAELHEPIIQQAVLLRGSPEAATDFLKFVLTVEAQEIMQQFGYEVPGA